MIPPIATVSPSPTVIWVLTLRLIDRGRRDGSGGRLRTRHFLIDLHRDDARGVDARRDIERHAGLDIVDGVRE